MPSLEPPHPLLAHFEQYISRRPQAFWDAYFLAFGKFMHEFATLEQGLLLRLVSLIVQRSGTQVVFPNEGGRGINPYEVIGSLAHGMRATPIRDAWKRTLRVMRYSDEAQKTVSDALSQFREIGLVRDRLGHHPASLDLSSLAGWLEVSNRSSAKEMESEDIIGFKIETLENMTCDLGAISVRVNLALRSEPLLSHEMEALAEPWRYKPSQLRKLRQQSPANPRPPSRQPKASEA